MTPEMSGKKQTNKGKGKQAQEAPATDTWRTSKCTDTDLLRLVSEGLLEPKEIVQWRAARSDPTPYEGLMNWSFSNISLSVVLLFLPQIFSKDCCIITTSRSINSIPTPLCIFPSLCNNAKPFLGSNLTGNSAIFFISNLIPMPNPHIRSEGVGFS